MLAIILKVTRNALGLVIVFINWLTRPKKTIRSESQQKSIQEAMKGISLYQFLSLIHI